MDDEAFAVEGGDAILDQGDRRLGEAEQVGQLDRDTDGVARPVAELEDHRCARVESVHAPSALLVDDDPFVCLGYLQTSGS
jgi:hypothetical protein